MTSRELTYTVDKVIEKIFPDEDSNLDEGEESDIDAKVLSERETEEVEEREVEEDDDGEVEMDAEERIVSGKNVGIEENNGEEVCEMEMDTFFKARSVLFFSNNTNNT